MNEKEKINQLFHSHPESNPDLSSNASSLLERVPNKEYLDEWTEILKQPPSSIRKEVLSVLVFRLGLEWFALPTIYFKEVTSKRPIHPIPHRSGKILKGVVNLNGELKLFIALDALLEISTLGENPQQITRIQHDRMIAIAKDDDLWVFSVDEIDGIYHWENFNQLENVPVNLSKSTAYFLKGIMKQGGKTIGLLDESLLFSSLKGNIL